MHFYLKTAVTHRKPEMCAVFNNYVSVPLSSLFQLFNNKVVYHPLFKTLLLTKHSTISENLSLCFSPFDS